ncbi:hypothetical protein [Cupriavidus pauculus]|uniref:hypothetical protein n=1 Tax=Cupriavidus pauculus TaxID=82633 RepID=UPI0030FB53D9
MNQPRSLDDVTGEEWNAASRKVLGQPSQPTCGPVIRHGLVFITECPEGAQLLALDGRVVLVAPGQPPTYVESTGLKPIEPAAGA